MNHVMKMTCLALVSAGLAMTTMQAHAANAPQMEKCYGIAKAGKNDCGGAKAETGHACQGLAVKSGDPYDWLLVPTGLCNKIAGGSTTAGGNS